MVFVYYLGVNALLSNMRITFVNKTEAPITNIRIEGCEEKQIAQMAVNKRKLKWITIVGDCHIDITYVKHGIEYKETVVSYASGPMGHRYEYQIGMDNTIF